MKKIATLVVAAVFGFSLSTAAFAEMTDLKVSGEIRIRNVDVNNYDNNSNVADSGNTTAQRTRINVDATVNETTKAYIQLQDTRLWGDNAATGAAAQNGNTVSTANNGAGNVDVSQAYIQLDQLVGQPLSLRLGRQPLAYGDQRLVGTFEWSNYSRRFDALKLIYNADAFSVDFWLSNVGEPGALSATGTEAGGTYQGTTANGIDAQFNGLYATLKSVIPTSTLDLYLLQKKSVGAVSGQSFLTYGLRLDGKGAGADWTAEYALQGGDASKTATITKTKKASMYCLKGGYTVANAANLRIGAEYDSASGPDASADDTAFDNLFPTNHPLYGVTDFGPTNTLTNLKAWSLNVAAKPANGLKLVAEYWNYSKDQGAATAIGNEMNIQAWYAINKNVDLHAFIARFTPSSDYSGATTDPADNVTLQLALKF